MSKKVLVVLAEGFEEIEAVVCVDLLRRAEFEVVVASINGKELVTGSHKITIKPDIDLENFKEVPDAIVLPGGLPGADNLAKSETVINLIKTGYEQDKVIAAICAAPAYVLVKTGILNGKKATCYPGCESHFTDKVTYTKEDITIDGSIITATGIGTVFDFSLNIIKKLKGETQAEFVKSRALIK